MGNSLIIRSSCSRLPDGALKSNLGDLVRSTVLLSCINDDFLWLTDKKAVNLLKWFVSPDKIITYDEGINHSLSSFSSELDVYNLDNHIPDSEVYKRIHGNWHGFVRNRESGCFPQNDKIAAINSYEESDYKISWQQCLIEGMGFQWNEQDYASCTVHGNVSHDIGLNCHVHTEWPSKRWPEENWKELDTILSKTYSVSWQQGINNLEEYISWLSSCRVIITCNTLGLHLASALRKKVIAIVGPTDGREFSYNRVSFVKPDSRDCMPCNLQECKWQVDCLSEIDANVVSKAVERII